MRKLLVIACLGLLFGCQSVKPSTTYIQADRATKTAVEPMLNITTKDHPELKDSVDDVLSSWEMRLKAAEHAQ
ncbi:MAG: hypothetical protein ACM359_10665 [Bacillota bacterium]